MELLTKHQIKNCTKTISICLYIDCKNFVQPYCKPTETVTSEYGDPCCYKTKVGWSIDGPFGFKLGGSRLINCNILAIKNIQQTIIAFTNLNLTIQVLIPPSKKPKQKQKQICNKNLNTGRLVAQIIQGKSELVS